MLVHEMQHTVMGAAKADILQNRIGVACEIAIGEEQKLCKFMQFRLGRGRAIRQSLPLRTGLRAFRIRAPAATGQRRI